MTPRVVAPVPTKPPVVAASPAGTKRTVTYRFHSFLEERHARHASKPPRRCTMLVLAEEVVRASTDRELELAIEIVGGDDTTLCDVGGKLALVATKNGVVVSGARMLGYDIRERIAAMHRRLGKRDGTFEFEIAKLPVDAPARSVDDHGVAYLDRASGQHDRFGPYPSEGSRSVSTKLRTRATDNTLACATARDSAQGVNFEYGGWSENSFESIVVDDGSGAPPCPR